MHLIKSKRTIVLAILATTALILLFYAGDKEYLQEKSADKVWVEVNTVINQMAVKGDLINYNANEGHNGQWSKYTNRFSEYISQINKKNEPHVKNRYQLHTSFRKLDSRVIIIFKVAEETTGQILEEKEIITDPIKYTSIIPAVLALFLCFVTARPAISLFVSLMLGSVLYNGGSVIMGTKEVFYNYIPFGLSGSNLNIILFFLVMSLLLRILAGAGGFKSLTATKGPIKYLIFPLLYFHPYSGVSAGTWTLHSFEKIRNRPLRSSFISHTISMLISSLFIISPYLLSIFVIVRSVLPQYDVSGGALNIFLNSLQYRFFSVAAIAMLIFFFIFKKETKSMRSIRTKEDTDPFSNKELVKVRPYMSVVFLLSFMVLFMISSLIIGIVQTDFNGSISAMFNISNSEIFRKLINPMYIKYYLAAADVSAALLLSTLLTLAALMLYVFKKRLLNIKDISSYSVSCIKSSGYFILTLMLTLSFGKILYDLGSAYYIISLFTVKIGTPYFPFICFIISTATAFMSGNSLISATVITPILLPIAAQIGGDNSVASAIAAVLEGCIAGELLSPYSPTAIIVSSIYQINPVKHSATLFPYIGIAVIASSLLGFLLSGTNTPAWLSYIALFIFFSLVMFKKTTKTVGSSTKKVQESKK